MFYTNDMYWVYLVLVLPSMLLAILASVRVNSTFKKYSTQLSRKNITGAEAARQVLAANGVHGVVIEHVSGNLTDHYNPKTNVIRLSDNVYSSTSTAAIGVACHEAGHAVQYAKSYWPIKIRAAIIPITNIGSKLAMPLILFGALISAAIGASAETAYIFVDLGIACFSLSLIFQLLTLPVEFNASSRALRAIKKEALLTPEEQRGARKTLTAAAMTYVAAVAVSLAQLLRLIILFGRRRNR